MGKRAGLVRYEACRVMISDVYGNELEDWHDIENSYQSRGRIPQNSPDFSNMIGKSMLFGSVQAATMAACTGFFPNRAMER